MVQPLGEPWDAAAAYDRIAAPRAKALGAPWPAVGRFVAALPRGALVLDVGVGSGRYFSMPEARGLRWLGLDVSREQLKLARRALPPRSGVARGDGRWLPVGAETVDAALVIAVVHHLGERQERVELLREVARTLKPGAPWLASAWSDSAGMARGATQAPGGGKADVFVPYHEGLDRPIDRFFHLYSEGELASDAREAGFKHGEERLEAENWFAQGLR